MEVGDLHDIEDKQWWYQLGAYRELAFIKQVCPHIGLQAIINPEKEHNPSTFDLLVGGLCADLKYRFTPFFTADSAYGISAQFAATFNRKDYLRYVELYPTITIYFWVNWEVTRFATMSVTPMAGVWKATLQQITSLIEHGTPLHQYKERQSNYNGNLKGSYVFDLRQLDCLTLVLNPAENNPLVNREEK